MMENNHIHSSISDLKHSIQKDDITLFVSGGTKRNVTAPVEETSSGDDENDDTTVSDEEARLNKDSKDVNAIGKHFLTLRYWEYLVITCVGLRQLQRYIKEQIALIHNIILEITAKTASKNYVENSFDSRVYSQTLNCALVKHVYR